MLRSSVLQMASSVNAKMIHVEDGVECECSEKIVHVTDDVECEC